MALERTRLETQINLCVHYHASFINSSEHRYEHNCIQYFNKKKSKRKKDVDVKSHLSEFPQCACAHPTMNVCVGMEMLLQGGAEQSIWPLSSAINDSDFNRDN